MKKVYIAYEGYFGHHGNQSYKILGVYTIKANAHDAVQQTITESGVEVVTGIVDGIPITLWIERGMDILNVGKVEEHTLID